MLRLLFVFKMIVVVSPIAMAGGHRIVCQKLDSLGKLQPQLMVLQAVEGEDKSLRRIFTDKHVRAKDINSVIYLYVGTVAAPSKSVSEQLEEILKEDPIVTRVGFLSGKRGARIFTSADMHLDFVEQKNGLTQINSEPFRCQPIVWVKTALPKLGEVHDSEESEASEMGQGSEKP
ncbi:MAG: hypothetical protein KDD33_12550 [Bdellovibrionales bacterium]|nr:hypothetical protein [Bdellovibrionales bacterium]